MRVAVLVVLMLGLAGCSGPPGLESDDPPEQGGGALDPRSGGSGGGTGGGTGTGGTGGNGGDGTPEPTVERAAMLLRFGLDDCAGVESLVELDAAAAQEALPEGYTAWVGAGALGDAAQAQYVWTWCSGLYTPTATVNDTAFGFVALRIEAPEDASEADEHWYRFRMLAQEDLLASLWRAAGYEVYAGEYASASQEPLLPEAPRDFDVALGSYRSQGAATLAFGDEPVAVAHYTETAAGRLEWEGDYAAIEFRAANGDLVTDPDDPLADARAASTGRAYEQRLMQHVEWVETDLWLRAP